MGVQCDLTLEDIPYPPDGRCPVLRILMKRNVGGRGSTDLSPTLDRIVPALGYVKGNVVVISKLANTIKSNATPQQIRAVADWYEAQLRSSGFMS